MIGGRSRRKSCLRTTPSNQAPRIGSQPDEDFGSANPGDRLTMKPVHTQEGYHRRGDGNRWIAEPGDQE